MNNTALVGRVETYTPEGWQFKAYQYKGMYNTEKQVSDVMLMTLPLTFPARWRPHCKHRLTFDLWFGAVVPVKQTTKGDQQHDPYTSLNFLDNIIATARETLELLGADEFIRLINDPAMTWFDSPQAQSVNSQAWLRVPLVVEVYNWID